MRRLFSLVFFWAAAEARLGHDEGEEKRDLQQFVAQVTNSKPYSLCQGDCDSDSDCQEGLKCFYLQPGDPLPFCSISEGEVTGKTDFCVPRALPDSLLGPSVHYVGNINRQSPNFPLGLCEADCDSDAHCQAGLICFQRNAGQPVPGCRGFDGSRSDYCINPSAQNNPSLPFTNDNLVLMFLNYSSLVPATDRQPTAEENAALTVVTDRWFTDETDRLFASNSLRLEQVDLTIANQVFVPTATNSHQLQYRVAINWGTTNNAAAAPSDLDIMGAINTGRYNTNTYQFDYLSRLDRTNPFRQTRISGRGSTLPGVPPP